MNNSSGSGCCENEIYTENGGFYWKMLYSGAGYLCLSLLFLFLLFLLIFYIFNQLYNPLSKKIWKLKDDITEIQKLLFYTQQQSPSNYEDDNATPNTTMTMIPSSPLILQQQPTSLSSVSYPTNYRKSLFPTTIPLPLSPPPQPPLVFSSCIDAPKTTTTNATTTTQATTINKTKRNNNQAHSLYINELSSIADNDNNCSNEDEFGYVICNNNSPPPHPPPLLLSTFSPSPPPLSSSSSFSF